MDHNTVLKPVWPVSGRPGEYCLLRPTVVSGRGFVSLPSQKGRRYWEDAASSIENRSSNLVKVAGVFLTKNVDSLSASRLCWIKNPYVFLRACLSTGLFLTWSCGTHLPDCCYPGPWWGVPWGPESSPMLLLPTGLSSLLFPVCWGLVVAFFWSAFFLVWFRFIVSALVAICNPKSKTRRLFFPVCILWKQKGFRKWTI